MYFTFPVDESVRRCNECAELCMKTEISKYVVHPYCMFLENKKVLMKDFFLCNRS